MSEHNELKKAVLLGLFDGVHIGHQAALKELNRCGVAKKLIYTFISNEVDTKGERKLLLTDREKRQMLLSNGADDVVFADFKSVRNMECRDFCRSVLKDELNADIILCGEDFRFGKGASGDSDVLKKECSKLGQRVIIVPTVMHGNTAVSTTRIRELILNGKIKEANSLLGYSYFISGEVVHGKAFGRQMGIRTINIAFDPSKLIPKFGVYSTDVMINGRRFKGITNVGTKPTVSKSNTISIETYILDFEGDLYNDTASIYFKDYYREERKFSSAEELKLTICQDIQRRKDEA